MDEVDPAFFCPENVFFICYIHMKEKIGKNIQYLLTWYVYGYYYIPINIPCQYLLTWYVYGYIVIPTQRKGHKGAQE